MKATEQIAHTRNKLKAIMEFKAPQSDVRLNPNEIQKINAADRKQLAVGICEHFLREAAGNPKVKQDILAIGQALELNEAKQPKTPTATPTSTPTAQPKQSSTPVPKVSEITLLSVSEKLKAGLMKACETFAMTMSFVAHAAAASALAIGGSELVIQRLTDPESRPNGSGEIAQWLGIGAQQTSEIGIGLLAGVNTATILVPTLAAIYWLYKRWANEKPGEHL